jgi:hypothetical protein
MYQGEIEDFPPEVVEKMLERQVEQGSPRNVAVFEANADSSQEFGGFDWTPTPENWEFWYKVIACTNFEVFFERYPKVDTLLNVFKL